jgi:hypothetical protein
MIASHSRWYVCVAASTFIACGGDTLAGMDGSSVIGKSDYPQDATDVAKLGSSSSDASSARDATSKPPADALSCSPMSPCLNTVASNQFLPNSIAVNSASIYWTNGGRGDFGSIVAMSTNGGVLTTLASNRESPGNVVLDSDNIYWIESTLTLLRMPLSGGSPATVGSGSIEDIAVDDSNIYWPDGADVNGAIMSIPKGGGVPATVASGQLNPFGVAIDDSYVYWTNLEGGNNVMRVSKSGGTPSTLESGLGGALGIAVDSMHVYWVDQANGGSLLYMPLDGGVVETIVSGQDPERNGIAFALDTLNVYLANFGSGASDGVILRVPLSGGTPATIASGEDGPTAIAVDATSVYWTTASEVRKLTPK